MGPIRCLSMRGGYSEDKAKFVFLTCTAVTRDNTCKLRQKRFNWIIRKKLSQ